MPSTRAPSTPSGTPSAQAPRSPPRGVSTPRTRRSAGAASSPPSTPSPNRPQRPPSPNKKQRRPRPASAPAQATGRKKTPVGNAFDALLLGTQIVTPPTSPKQTRSPQ